MTAKEAVLWIFFNGWILHTCPLIVYPYYTWHRGRRAPLFPRMHHAEELVSLFNLSISVLSQVLDHIYVLALYIAYYCIFCQEST